MDFVHGQLVTGRKQRVLAVVDTFSRLSPVVDPRFSYRGEDVVLTLDQTCKLFGYPKTIRVDQGSEFISRDLDLWAYQNDVVLDFSRPGKPKPGNPPAGWPNIGWQVRQLSENLESGTLVWDRTVRLYNVIIPITPQIPSLRRKGCTHLLMTGGLG